MKKTNPISGKQNLQGIFSIILYGFPFFTTFVSRINHQNAWIQQLSEWLVVQHRENRPW